MASVNYISVMDGETVTTNTASSTVYTEAKQDKFIAVLQVTAITGGTVAGTLQHSANGTNWTTIATFSGLAATGEEVQQITANVLPAIRANLTYAGTTSTVSVKLFYDKV